MRKKIAIIEFLLSAFKSRVCLWHFFVLWKDRNPALYILSVERGFANKGRYFDFQIVDAAYTREAAIAWGQILPKHMEKRQGLLRLLLGMILIWQTLKD